jgi:hypothetical protein
MITAAGATETVIKNSLLSILEQDSYKTQSAGQIRSPGLDHDATSPGFILLMINPVPHTKVSMSLDFIFGCRRPLYSLLGKLFQGPLSYSEYILSIPFPQD